MDKNSLLDTMMYPLEDERYKAGIRSLATNDAALYALNRMWLDLAHSEAEFLREGTKESEEAANRLRYRRLELSDLMDIIHEIGSLQEAGEEPDNA